MEAFPQRRGQIQDCNPEDYLDEDLTVMVSVLCVAFGAPLYCVVWWGVWCTHRKLGVKSELSTDTHKRLANQ